MTSRFFVFRCRNVPAPKLSFDAGSQRKGTILARGRFLTREKDRGTMRSFSSAIEKSGAMKALAIQGFGDPNVFQPVAFTIPEPGPGEVLVKMAATSVNPIDIKCRQAHRPITNDLPAILGCDVSGTVVKLGSDASSHTLREGDRVYGCAGGVRGVGGTYAQYISADARLLSLAPDPLDAREAAALPLVTITAWEGLERAGVKQGDKVLIHGGAGGVGHIAIQLAKVRGAEVFTTVSSPVKEKIATDLGADHTINYRNVGVVDYVKEMTGGDGFDVVFDATGGSNISSSFEAAKVNGQVVTIVSQYEADLSLMHFKGLSLHVVFMLINMLHNLKREKHGQIMQETAQLVREGRLRPLIDQSTFSLDNIADAHRHVESGKAIGKVVVDIDV